MPTPKSFDSNISSTNNPSITHEEGISIMSPANPLSLPRHPSQNCINQSENLKCLKWSHKDEFLMQFSIAKVLFPCVTTCSFCLQSPLNSTVLSPKGTSSPVKSLNYLSAASIEWCGVIVHSSHTINLTFFKYLPSLLSCLTWQVEFFNPGAGNLKVPYFFAYNPHWRIICRFHI